MPNDIFGCWFWQDLELFQIRGFPSAFWLLVAFLSLAWADEAPSQTRLAPWGGGPVRRHCGARACRLHSRSLALCLLPPLGWGRPLSRLGWGNAGGSYAGVGEPGS